MEAAERATALRAIVDQLGRGDWDDANVVLEAFGFRTSFEGSFTGSLKAYVLNVVSDTDDDTLRGLHAYLTTFTQNRADPGCWTAGRLRLFASYRDVHRREVGAVRERVALAGVETFAAHESIEVSKEWQQVIEDALRSCDAAVVFLHSGFRDSVWTDQEVGYCLDRRAPIFLAKYEDDPHGFMGKYQAADCGGLSPAQIGDLILMWLCDEPRTQAAMAEAATAALILSDSFGQTRLILDCLTRLPAFTADQLRRLENAAATNPQVARAFYGSSSAPAVVNRLVAERSAPRS